MTARDLLVDRIENGYMLGEKWKIIDFINNGGCANVYLVENKKGERYAAKVTVNSLSFTLGHEFDIYKILKGSPQVPKLPRRAFGYDSGYTYLIMQLLGKNLRQFRRNFINKQVPLNIIKTFALQMLDFIQFIHEKGYLYVDIKPENFMVDVNVNADMITNANDLKIFCVDFGLSQKFIINGKHRAFKYVKARVGTLNFMSVNVESKILPSRRDDLESFVYVLIFLQKGNFPWEYVTSDEEGYSMKFHIERYISDINPNLLTILNKIKDLAYTQEPNYDEIRALIRGLDD
jgi:serine/threonine protein kinase